MSLRFDLSDPESREEGLAAAVNAVRRGQLIVLPTDTVYGLGVDAFEPDGVQRLLDAKGRGRDMPPPVLVSATPRSRRSPRTCPGWATGLVDHYWPGPLTIVCRQQPSLRWDLGDDPRHGGGTDARRRARPRAARPDRAAGGVLGEQPRSRRRDGRRRRRGDARLGDRRDPRRRPEPRWRRPRRSSTAPASGRGSCARERSRGPSSQWCCAGSAPCSRTTIRWTTSPRNPTGRRVQGVREYLLVFLVAGRRQLPAVRRRPRAGDQVRSRGPGPRPRRARDPDPVLRRRRDARRARRRDPGGPPPAVPEHLAAGRLPRRRGGCSRRGR